MLLDPISRLSLFENKINELNYQLDSIESRKEDKTKLHIYRQTVIELKKEAKSLVDFINNTLRKIDSRIILNLSLINNLEKLEKKDKPEKKDSKEKEIELEIEKEIEEEKKEQCIDESSQKKEEEIISEEVKPRKQWNKDLDTVNNIIQNMVDSHKIKKTMKNTNNYNYHSRIRTHKIEK
jgi:hypothetical protein